MGDGRVMPMRYEESGQRSSRRSSRPPAQAQPSTSSPAEWTEHISSSGKKYYYNAVSEVSQWEKPAAWLLAEEERRRKASQVPEHPAHQAHHPSHHPAHHPSHHNSHHNSQRNSQHNSYHPYHHSSHSSAHSHSAHPAQSGQQHGSQGSHQLGAAPQGQQASGSESPTPDIVVLPHPDSVEGNGGRWENGGTREVARPKPQPTPPPPVPGLSVEVERLGRSLGGGGAEVGWRGWNAAQLEQQADLVVAAGEGGGGAGGKLGQLAVELKCARSLVRTAEIRSTLLEQRVLFVKDQYHQLHSNSLT